MDAPWRCCGGPCSWPRCSVGARFCGGGATDPRRGPAGHAVQVLGRAGLGDCRRPRPEGEFRAEPDPTGLHGRGGRHERAIVDFRAEADGPVRMALLFDVSGSMRLGSRASDARQAARQVFAALRLDGRRGRGFQLRHAAWSRVQAVHRRLRALDAHCRRGRPYGQTSLYDAIAQTARARSTPVGGPGRSAPQRGGRAHRRASTPAAS